MSMNGAALMACLLEGGREEDCEEEEESERASIWDRGVRDAREERASF